MNSSLSVKAAAERVYGETLTESVIPSPKGPYGESKQQAEQYLLRHQITENIQAIQKLYTRPNFMLEIDQDHVNLIEID